MFHHRDLSIAQYRMFPCHELAGLRLDVKCDANRIRFLDFLDGKTLCINLDGEILQADYLASKAADRAYFVHTELPFYQYHRGLSFVYDAASGYITFLYARHGHIPEAPRKVEHSVIFAKTGEPSENIAPPCFTDLHVGHQVDYRYSEGFCVRHHYLEPHRFCWSITKEHSFPQFIGIPHEEYCDAVRLNGELFLFSWLEAESGTQGAFVLNTTHMRSTGAFFGVGPDGKPESYTMGAFAEFIK